MLMLPDFNLTSCFQSSTLMLIESAKDSLSFSVTHYKHPKQPQTVQVGPGAPDHLTISW